MVIAPEAAGEPGKTTRTETLIVLSLAVAAAVAIKVPALFGLQLGSGDEPFYARNASLFVLPQLTAYFAWKRGLAVARFLRRAATAAGGKCPRGRRAGARSNRRTNLRVPLHAERVAALGENLILLVNLTWSAWLYARFLRQRGSFPVLEQWQIAYLPVYSVWAAFVRALVPNVSRDSDRSPRL